MGLSKPSVCHLESMLRGRDSPGGLPRETSLEGERQKVQEQRGLPGPATERWHGPIRHTNKSNNNNNGGYNPIEARSARHCAHSFQSLSHFLPTREVGTITIPTSQIRTLRLGEVKELAQGPIGD